jgi:hypothetical protein
LAPQPLKEVEPVDLLHHGRVTGHRVAVGKARISIQYIQLCGECG